MASPKLRLDILVDLNTKADELENGLDIFLKDAGITAEELSGLRYPDTGTLKRVGRNVTVFVTLPEGIKAEEEAEKIHRTQFDGHMVEAHAWATNIRREETPAKPTPETKIEEPENPGELPRA